MKDEALQKAIDYVGGQEKLAGIIGTNQPRISRMKRCHAEFVLLVEKATKGTVTRYQLRPDLYPPHELKKRKRSP